MEPKISNFDFLHERVPYRYRRDAFSAQNGLKQRNSLSLSVFSFALGYSIKKHKKIGRNRTRMALIRTTQYRNIPA
jgi:hypothetical protein